MIYWEIGWLDKARQALGLPPSQAERQRRLEYIKAWESQAVTDADGSPKLRSDLRHPWGEPE